MESGFNISPLSKNLRLFILPSSSHCQKRGSCLPLLKYCVSMTAHCRKQFVEGSVGKSGVRFLTFPSYLSERKSSHEYHILVSHQNTTFMFLVINIPSINIFNLTPWWITSASLSRLWPIWCWNWNKMLSLLFFIFLLAADHGHRKGLKIQLADKSHSQRD